MGAASPCSPSDFQPGQSVQVPSPWDRALNTFMTGISAGWPQVPTELRCSPWAFARCDSPCVESASCPEQWESSTPRVWKVQDRPWVITRSDLKKIKMGWSQQIFYHPQAQVLWCSTTSKKLFRCTLLCVDSHLSTSGVWPGTFSAVGSSWLQGREMAGR